MGSTFTSDVVITKGQHIKFNATVKIEDVSPEKAASMLEKLHSGQRKLREGWVQRLIGEIKTDHFRLTGDALIIVEDTLMNGQHRLTAVARSGVTCPFLVMRSDDPDIYRIIDAGAKRNVYDVISVEHKAVVAGMASWVMQYDLKTLSQFSRRSGSAWQREILRSKVIEFIDKNRNELQASAGKVALLYKKSRLLAPSLGAAFMFIANRERGGGKGTEFVESLYSGDGSGVLRMLRESLINNRLSKKKWPAVYQFGLIIKAFRYWEDGKRPDSVRLRTGEAYPSLDQA